MVYPYELIIRDLVSSGFGLNLRRAFWIDLPVTFMVAWFSYKLYERPIIDWGRASQALFRSPEKTPAPGLPGCCDDNCGL